MYRANENPWKLEDILADAQRRLSEAKARRDDPDDMIDLYIEIEELKERVNFAWQDAEV